MCSKAMGLYEHWDDGCCEAAGLIWILWIHALRVGIGNRDVGSDGDSKLKRGVPADWGGGWRKIEGLVVGVSVNRHNGPGTTRGDWPTWNAGAQPKQIFEDTRVHVCSMCTILLTVVGVEVV